MKKKIRKDQRTIREPQCDLCINCIPIGCGDHTCDAEEPRIVLDEFMPTSDYMWCHGTRYIER